jgi:hypothetical protein
LAAANYLHELKEYFTLGEWLPWKNGPIGWFLDTESDMMEVFVGARVGSLEDCIPGECRKRPKALLE